VRLRAWAAGLLFGAAGALALTSAGIAAFTGQVHAIGDHAAPQAATASDLYFAISDMDAQVARLIMLGGAENLSSNRLDALRSYQARSAEANADLAEAVRGATTAAERALCQRLAGGLSTYRQWSWEALAVQAEQPDQAPGRPPAAALGYYSQASTVLHAQLLPAAGALRQSSLDDLDRAAAGQRSAARWATGGSLLAGGALVAALVIFQARLSRRYHRAVNPGLLLATLCTAGLVVSAGAVLLAGSARLDAAQRDSFAPYLALTQAQAVSYDAAGDTSRYLIATDRSGVRSEVAAKSRCLTSGGSCRAGGAGGGDVLSAGLTTLTAGPGAGTGQPEAVLRRWQAYQRDHDRIVSLADAGRLEDAVSVLTGTARGDASFDFYYYDVAVRQIAGSRRAAFEASLAGVRSRLAPWPAIPAGLMLAAMLLILLGVRPRLAEYR
jgi:hypothetical protein